MVYSLCSDTLLELDHSSARIPVRQDVYQRGLYCRDVVTICRDAVTICHDVVTICRDVFIIIMSRCCHNM